MLDQTVLQLFNAVIVETHDEKNTRDWATFSRMISNGYICTDEIPLSKSLMTLIEKTVGIGGAKMNASFHKSWEKVASASDEQLFIEQILHYITTYGFESLGIYDSKLVYIPAEKLDIPSVTENIHLVVIRGMTDSDIMKEIIKLGSSGIALSQETVDGIMTIVEGMSFGDMYGTDFVAEIKNRELYTRLCDLYKIVPTEPVAFLRYVIAKLTGESLVIKNGKLIAKIKESDGNVLDELLESAPENLASIFLRYKPLFLAMKSISKNKRFFNRVRKAAVYAHEPLAPDYLNTVTAQIKDKSLKLRELSVALTNYSLWRKVRLAYALSNRLHAVDSIVYKVRNGKGWVTDFQWSNSDNAKTERAMELTLHSIASDISANVEGKVIYIPRNVHYALPATEKQFVGNVPANTWCCVDEDLIVGIHWYNHESESGEYLNGRYYNDARVDIDLSLMDASGKYGWDGQYRNDSRTVLFSGDVVDAPLPNGATEFFYIKNGVDGEKLIMTNYFTFKEGNPVLCQLVVAKETPRKSFSKNYMVDPNNIIMSQTVNIKERQNVIGLITSVDGEMRVYFTATSVGNTISARAGDMLNKAREYNLSVTKNTIELADVLSMAGALIVDEIPEDGDYIDLSPQALDKTTIINLLSTE